MTRFAWVLIAGMMACKDAGTGKDSTDATSDTDPVTDTDVTGGGGGGGGGGGAGGHHPAGYADSDVHGHDAKFQVETCINCHGADLTGDGDAVSCDSCHEDGWRTNCTFCHGDPADGTGSPPVHISGVDDALNASFIPHRAHTGETALHAAFDCVQCHNKPEDVLTPGHIFVGDNTPGVAEADFSAGLSQAGKWNAAAGSCSNLYCHGNGRGNNGKMVDTGDIKNCHQCHMDKSSGFLNWLKMSGEHSKHLSEGFACAECHSDTVDASNKILDVTLHVNGVKDVHLPNGITFSGGQCTGSCHGENHGGRTW